jgi:diaminopimelate epimerase
MLQNSGLFPQGVNVGFAQLLGRDAIRLRVVERGVGETLACGSGACAAVAILARQGKVDRRVDVQLPGGTLTIEWPDDAASIRMSGPAAFVFEGEWDR